MLNFPSRTQPDDNMIPKDEGQRQQPQSPQQEELERDLVPHHLEDSASQEQSTSWWKTIKKGVIATAITVTAGLAGAEVARRIFGREADKKAPVPDGGSVAVSKGSLTVRSPENLYTNQVSSLTTPEKPSLADSEEMIARAEKDILSANRYHYRPEALERGKKYLLSLVEAHQFLPELTELAVRLCNHEVFIPLLAAVDRDQARYDMSRASCEIRAAGLEVMKKLIEQGYAFNQAVYFLVDTDRASFGEQPPEYYEKSEGRARNDLHSLVLKKIGVAALGFLVLLKHSSSDEDVSNELDKLGQMSGFDEIKAVITFMTRYMTRYSLKPDILKSWLTKNLIDEDTDIGVELMYDSEFLDAHSELLQSVFVDACGRYREKNVLLYSKSVAFLFKTIEHTQNLTLSQRIEKMLPVMSEALNEGLLASLNDRGKKYLRLAFESILTQIASYRESPSPVNISNEIKVQLRDLCNKAQNLIPGPLNLDEEDINYFLGET